MFACQGCGELRHMDVMGRTSQQRSYPTIDEFGYPGRATYAVTVRYCLDREPCFDAAVAAAEVLMSKMAEHRPGRVDDADA